MPDVRSLDDRIRDALRLAADRAGFDPTRWRTLERPRRRSFPQGIGLAAAAAVLILSLVVPLIALSVLRGEDQDVRPAVESPIDDPRMWESCRDEPLDSQVVDPSAGPPGTEIEIHGALDTRWERSPAPEEFQIWWNLDPEKWRTAIDGMPTSAVEGAEVIQLKRQFVSYSAPGGGAFCPYQLIVRAPEAEPGIYPLVVLYAGHDEPPRWAPLPSVEFMLTSPITGAQVEPVAIEDIRLSDDDEQLVVTYIGGTSDCFVFDHVEVTYNPNEVVVGVFERHLPGTGPCFSNGLSQTTTVDLEQPLGDRTLRAREF